jgi:hypothetical protein
MMIRLRLDRIVLELNDNLIRRVIANYLHAHHRWVDNWLSFEPTSKWGIILMNDPLEIACFKTPTFSGLKHSPRVWLAPSIGDQNRHFPGKFQTEE